MATNPVVIALEQELGRFIQSTKSNVTEKENARSINALFSIWNTYESRINKDIFAEKLLTLGDFLSAQQCYKMASTHCYGRHLQLKLPMLQEAIEKVTETTFLSTFFCNEKYRNEVTTTLCSLLGYASSTALNVISHDGLLQNKTTTEKVLSMLKLLQLTTQVALRKDSNCWLVYNGTVHIYTICRKFMSFGLSSLVLEYLIWACVCMESSVPLMTANYLGWRSQLYTTTCQCYYDLKADHVAEEFAKRGLQKINELQEIKKMSASVDTPESVFAFKQAYLKMNVMIFKRNVFESRKRPKGVLRPKMKQLLKDIVTNPWPRTGTERLLAETFMGRAAQFLAILEAMTNSNRRLLQTSLGAPESDDCMFDVYMELFFAGMEIVGGGGGIKPQLPGRQDTVIKNVVCNLTLIDLASAESQSISISSIVRFVKILYNYENWDIFDTLITPTIEELKKYPNDKECCKEVKMLELLSAVSCVNPSRVKKKFVMLKTDENLESPFEPRDYKAAHIDELLNVSNLMNRYLTDKGSKLFVASYHDMLLDAVLFLWSKCKNNFSRIYSPVFESHKSVYQDPLFFKWLQILIMTQKSMIQLNVSKIDACATAESSLKLAMILECLAVTNVGGDEETSMDLKSGSTVGSAKSVKSNDSSMKKVLLRQHLSDVTKYLNLLENNSDLLKFTDKMLTSCLTSINTSRDETLTIFGDVSDSSFNESSGGESEDMFNLNLKSIHLELMYYQHYIQMLCQTLSIPTATPQSKGKLGPQKKLKKPVNINATTNADIMSTAGKNDLSRAMYLMSLVQTRSVSDHKEISSLVEEAYQLLQKAVQVEDKIRSDNLTKKETVQNIPPAPVLLCRGCTSIILKPADFVPKDGEKIAWYCLYLRNASGNNVKVRLGDTQFMGTGEQIPFGNNCTFTVKGLIPNERYVAAVAAFDKNGKLIGGTIGQTGRPFLAAHPLPVILAYAHLAKVAYQCNVLRVSKLSCLALWNHFVEPCPFINSNIRTINNNHKLQPKRLKMSNLKNTSTIVQRYFVQSIFIMVDIAVKEGCLFCDSLCDQGPATNGQVSRLSQCERLLIAVEISGWLNDNMLCLQAVLHTYGLLAPIIYWKLSITPVLEILSHIFGVLQEIHTIFKNKRQTSTSESLQHMVSCLSYYVAKMLVQHDVGKSAALSVLEMGSKVLNQLVPPDSASMSDANSVTGKKLKKHAKRIKARAILKSFSDFSSAGTSSSSIRALEIYTMKLQKEGSSESDLELSGTEDPVILNAIVSVLPPHQAYKEVLKFKRRTQFLESFVGILAKASNDQLHESILDWTRETMTWLTRRNEIILNKSLNDHRGVVVIAANSDDEKLKRYSAGVVEYGKAVDGNAQKSSLDSDKLDEKLVNKIEEKAKNNATFKDESDVSQGLKVTKLNTTAKVIAMMTVAEKRTKDAVAKVQSRLPEVWMAMQRRKKMRVVCHEELPWRSQMNHITAGSYFNKSMDKLSALAKKLGHTNLQFDDSIMDVNWYNLSTSGCLIVSWAGCMKTIESIHQRTVDIGGKTVEHEAEVHIAPSTSPQSLSFRVDKRNSMVSRKGLLEAATTKHDDVVKQFKLSLEQTYLHYRRSLVLSHRGENWVLLQQTCVNMLTTTQTLMMKIMLLNSNMDTTKQEMPFNIFQLRSVICKPFSLAAEFLLDLMMEMKSAKSEEGSNSIMYGDVRQNRGGSSLKFDLYFDDNSYIDYGNIKRVIMFTIEVLFYEEKWEHLCSIIMRFNALSQDHFSESLYPLLIVSQRHLEERVNNNGTLPKPMPNIIFDENTGIPIEVQYGVVAATSIEVGAHIDPDGHNLYTVPDDGLKYSSVPMDVDASFKRLHAAMDAKHYSSRMLEQSRKLLLLYLAGKQTEMTSESKLVKGSSRVSFVASQVKPPSVDPVHISMLMYESLEDVENYPLVDNQLSVVIGSYDRTIEMLLNRQQKDLAAQAMHELGNVMFHMKNIRSAYKWWSSALDCILQDTDAQNTWRKYLDLNTDVINSNKILLERCGVWGCMLAGVLATKIARYIHFANVDMCQQTCEMASCFFKALFCSSLTYPSSYQAYASYDVIENQVVGLNLFSDLHRMHCANVTASLIWLTKFIIKQGFYLQAQPLLALSQYLTNTVCKDMVNAVVVKLLRVESLSKLHMFSTAVRNFIHIISGKHLPGADALRNQLVQKWGKFEDAKSLTDVKNLKFISDLCEFTLSAVHFTTYGKTLCDRISIYHSILMISLAETIFELPTTSKQPETNNKIEMKDPMNSKTTENNSNKSLSKKSEEKVIDISSSSTKERMSLKDLKSKILSAAETQLQDLMTQIGEPKDSDDEQLYVFINCHILLSKICKEKLFALSATKHAFMCLQAVSDSSLSVNVEELRTNLSPSLSLYPSKETMDNPNTDIDINMWLQCRELVCNYLLAVDDAVGQLAGASLSVVKLSGRVDENIELGVIESQMFNDSGMKVRFEMKRIKHDLKNGHDIDRVLESLKVLCEKLDKKWTEFSYPLKQLQFEAKMLLADLNALKVSDLNVAVKRYAEIEQDVLTEMLSHGYDVDGVKNFPVSPHTNIHSQLYDVLLTVKVRCCRCKALLNASNTAAPVYIENFQKVLREINESLNTYERMTSKDVLIKLELLVVKGEIQRILFENDRCGMNPCIETFLDVVRFSNAHTQDLSLIRLCYIEMALTFITMLCRKREVPPSEVMTDIQVSVTNKKRNSTPQFTSKNLKISASKTKMSKAVQRLKKGAWVCIRTAAIIAKAQRKFELLAGETSITSQTITGAAAEGVPAFALEDIMGAVYQPSRTINDEGIVDIDNGSTSKSVEVTWVHILNYATYLRRNCNYSSLAISSEDVQIVRIPNHCTARAIKLAAVCEYMVAHLSVYTKECSPILPIEIITSVLAALQSSDQPCFHLPTTPLSTPVPPEYATDEMPKPDAMVVFSKESATNGIAEETAERDISSSGSQGKRLVSNTEKTPERSDRIHLPNPIHAGEFEVALQWYKPELISSSQSHKVYVLAALNGKPISGNSTSTSFSQSASIYHNMVDEKECVIIHEEFMKIVQAAEASIVMQGHISRSAVAFATVTAMVPKSPTATKKNRLSLSVKVNKTGKNDGLKEELSQAITHVMRALGNETNSSEVLLFDSSWKNIVCLESMFNPSLGHVTTTAADLYTWFLHLFNKTTK